MHRRPKLCLVAASPLTIHFFMKPHVRELAKSFDVSLVFNAESDTYVLPLGLPARQISVGIKRKMSPFSDAVTLCQLINVLRREKFDIVVSAVPKAGLLGMLAAKLTGVACRVHVFQGEVWASAHGWKRYLLKTMDRITAYCATSVLAVSKSEKQFLEVEGIVKQGKTSVLGSGSISGVDLYKFMPNAVFRLRLRQELKIPDDAIVCLFLGRLAVDKGIRQLVAAFNQCAPENERLWLLIAGPDEERQAKHLKQLIRADISSRMIVEGFTETPEHYMAASDFLCLPSFREGFGMVILEAAAVKIPAIGSRIYGITDAIVDGKTGLLVAAGDVVALSHAMNDLSTNADKRLQMGQAGRLRAESEFDQTQVVARYVQYFKNLVSDETIV